MKISDIQRFCMHDGPGVRTTVFFKGCPLRCVWCHNPETKNAKSELLFYSAKCIGCRICESCENGVHNFANTHIVSHNLCLACGTCAKNCPTGALELSGSDMSAEEVFAEVIKDKAFYGDNGGITLSGGEPLMQAKEAAELLRMCKDSKISTVIETSGYFEPSVLKEIVPLCDLFLWDVKDTVRERHKKYTGADNVQILENLRLADGLGAKTRLRLILVNGVNTDAEHYNAVANIVQSLNGCEGVEFLPYHSYGASKSIALGAGNCSHNEWIPSDETVSYAKEYIKRKNINVF